MATKITASSQRPDDNYDPRILNWCAWKVFFPLVVILLLWPAAYWLVNFDHPFPEAFKHGDLIIFSALILIEAAVEGEGVRFTSWRDHALEITAKAFAFICILAFAALKIDVMFQEKAHDFKTERLIGYSVLGWSIAVVAVFISINTYIKAHRLESTRSLKRLEEEAD